MNMQPMARPIGMVPLARAAALLSGSGKPIHQSNIGRYLDRFPEIPNRRDGKRRLVDYEALAKHRGENVNVIEKEASALPSASSTAAPPTPALPTSADVSEEQEETEAPKVSTLNSLSEQLKRLQLRHAEIDLQEREKKLVPVEEVFSLISTTLGEFINALQRQDGEIAQQYGQPMAADMRRRRKAAQAVASANIARLAREIMEAHDATTAVDLANPQEPSQEEGLD